MSHASRGREKRGQVWQVANSDDLWAIFLGSDRAGCQAENDRAAGLANLEAASDVRRVSDELDAVRHAAHVGAGTAWSLNALHDSPSEAVRRAAAKAQQTLMAQLRPPPVEPAPIDNWLFRKGYQIEERVKALAEMVAAAQPGDRRLRAWWSWGGLVLTAAVAGLIITGYWWVAVGGLALRVVVSLGLGAPSNLPFEGYTVDGKASDVVYRCIAGHVSDTVPLMALAWVLAVQGRTGLAALLVTAFTAMLIVTLLRVAALQVGVQVPRQVLERVLRTGSVVLALVCGELISRSAGSRATDAAWLAAFGPLAYAFGEAARTAMHLHHDKGSVGGLSTIQVTVVQADGEVGSLTNHVPRTPPVPVRLEGSTA